MFCDQVDCAQIRESVGVSVLSCHHTSYYVWVQLMCLKRGMHAVENEMVFQSNADFVFHDSQGFEVGGIEEFEQMKNFVTKHASTTFLKKRIHAIW